MLVREPCPVNANNNIELKIFVACVSGGLLSGENLEMMGQPFQRLLCVITNGPRAGGRWSA